MIGWADTGQLSMRYRLEGAVGAAQTVVLIHELGGCLESWDPVTQVLPHESRILSYDWRGAGLSEKPVGAVSLNEFSDDLEALLAVLDITEPVLLVGCAVGAAIAIRFAATHPTRAAGLVLLAPATGIGAAKRAQVLDLAQRIESEGLRERILERFDHSYAERYFAGRQDRLSVRSRLLQADPHSYAQVYRMLCALEMDADLAALSLPTWVIAGAQDGTRPPNDVERVASAIRDSRFEVIESGHVMHVLTPVLVADRIHNALRALRGRKLN